MNILLIEHEKGYSLKKQYGYRLIYGLSQEMNGIIALENDFVSFSDKLLSDTVAYTQLDNIFETYFGGDKFESLRELLSENYILAIKNHFFEVLSRICFSFHLAEKFKKKHGINESFDFLPKDFPFSLYKIIKEKTGLFSQDIQIPQWYLNKMQRKEIFEKLFQWFGIRAYLFMITLKMKKMGFTRIIKKKYNYGINIWSSLFLDTINGHVLPSILHQSGIFLKDNTLLVVPENMNSVNAKALNKENLDICYFTEMINNFSVKDYFRYVFPKLHRLIKGCSLNLPPLAIRFYCSCVKNLIEREILHRVYNIQSMIYYQEPGNAINILHLKRKNIKSYFIYSSSTPDNSKNGLLNTLIFNYYSYLAHDCMISNTMSINYFSKNGNFIKEYVDCGNFFSDRVFNVRKDRSLQANMKKIYGIKNDKILLGFFDTAIGGGGVLSNSYGEKIYDYVFKLIDENPQYELLLKTRNLNKFLFGTKIHKKYQRVRNHPRVFSINANEGYHSVYEFMGLCDVIIGCHFSSVIKESLAGGIPTVCYFPQDCFDSTIFNINKLQNGVFDTYVELERLVQYWLKLKGSKISQSSREKYVKKYIDQFSDGQAMNRLKKFLEV